MNNPEEPWKDSLTWASSNLSIALGRLVIAIARALPGTIGFKMEENGLRQIMGALAWQKKEQESFEEARRG